jgi:hypothetical protein
VAVAADKQNKLPMNLVETMIRKAKATHRFEKAINGIERAKRANNMEGGEAENGQKGDKEGGGISTRDRWQISFGNRPAIAMGASHMDGRQPAAPTGMQM